MACVWRRSSSLMRGSADRLKSRLKASERTWDGDPPIRETLINGAAPTSRTRASSTSSTTTGVTAPRHRTTRATATTCRCCPGLTTTRSARPSPRTATPAGLDLRRHSRAPAGATGATHGIASSRSTLITATISDTHTTSTCSTIQPSTTPWKPGSRSSPLRATQTPPFSEFRRATSPLLPQVRAVTNPPKVTTVNADLLCPMALGRESR